MSPSRTDSQEAQAHSDHLTDRALGRLFKMDRTEEICLVTMALCAFGSALAAQHKNS